MNYIDLLGNKPDAIVVLIADVVWILSSILFLIRCFGSNELHPLPDWMYIYPVFSGIIGYLVSVVARLLDSIKSTSIWTAADILAPVLIIVWLVIGCLLPQEIKDRRKRLFADIVIVVLFILPFIAYLLGILSRWGVF